MEPVPPSEPEKPKRKRVWRVLGWTVVVLIVSANAIYYLSAEPVRRVRASIHVYNSIGFQPRMYSNDHEGLYPPLSPEAGRLMLAPEAVTRDDVNSFYGWFYPGEPGHDRHYNAA